MKTIIAILMLITAGVGYGYPIKSPSSGFDQAAVSAFGNAQYKEEAINLGDRFAEVKLTSAEVKRLYSTPILVVTSPGEGKAIVPIGAYSYLDFQSAAWAFNSNNHVDVEFGGSGSGNIAISIAEDKLGEATSDTIVYTPATETVLSENKGLWVHTSGANPTVGDSPIWIRVYYKVVPYPLSSSLAN